MVTTREVVVDFADARRQLRVPSTLYVDTADVRRAVLGANEYIRRRGDATLAIDLDEFRKPAVLVAALLAAEMLGPFAMLPPHQAEFMRQLQNGEAFNRYATRPDQDAFLRAAGIEVKWGAELTPTSSSEMHRRLLREHVGERTENFFKAIQCVRFQWWEQLRRLHAKKTFVAFEERVDYDHLARDPRLAGLLKAFRDKRGMSSHDHRLSKNNFTDAMALLILADLVKRYRDGQLRAMPRFFDSTGLFTEIAASESLLEELTVDVDGCKLSALVTTESLVYFAALKFQPGKIDDAIDTMNEAFGDRVVDQIDRLVLEGGSQSLGARVRQFKDLSFLENVWMPTMAVDELQGLCDRWVDESALAGRFRRSIEQTIEDSAQGVLNGALAYRRFGDAWHRLLDLVLKLRSRRREQAASSGKVAREIELGLFRFCPDRHTQEAALKCIEGLLDDTIEDREVASQAAWHRFVVSCSELANLASPENAERESPDMDFAAAMLWSIGERELAVEYLEGPALARRSRLVSTIYAASALPLGRNLSKVEALVDDMCAELDRNSSSSPEVGDAEVMVRASCIAYLSFHIWRAKLPSVAWWRSLGENAAARERRERANPRLLQAIGYADLAWNHAERVSGELADLEDFRERKLFVANQRLYYLTEQGDKRRIDDMEDASTFLSAHYANFYSRWRLTYYDTLGRYCAFRAFHADTAAVWKQRMHKARDHVAKAQDASDRDIDLFAEYVAAECAIGFRPERRKLWAVRHALS